MTKKSVSIKQKNWILALIESKRDEFRGASGRALNLIWQSIIDVLALVCPGYKARAVPAGGSNTIFAVKRDVGRWFGDLRVSFLLFFFVWLC